MIRARSSARDWPARYANRLAYTDLVVVVGILAIFGAVALPDITAPLLWPSGPDVPYIAVLGIVAWIWLVALMVLGTRERHIVGNGILEYRRVVNATVAVFAVTITLAFFLRIEVSRALFVVALPAGALALVGSRWLWRQWLRKQQSHNEYVYRALVLAEPSKAAHVVRSIRRTHGTGFDLVGVVTNARGVAEIGGVPVVGGFGNIAAAMDAADADTVIIAGSDELNPEIMRRLGWEVADREGNLVVAPALTDIAGPRIHSRPAAGLPLVYVEYPTLEGGPRFAKRTFDIVVSVVFLVLLSPVFLATAIAIKRDSPGPVFYRQTRVGRGGREFGMLKFRSMETGSDDQLDSLLDLQGTADRPLHKVVDDPRITRVGRFLRKHSIDELPQLVNVLMRDMSLVGPRPQRASEVALYDDAAYRRLLVKPGMSGLWQVSGRSMLSWEDAVRLDLYYVENWSFTQDLQILFRTIRAVVAPGDSAK